MYVRFETAQYCRFAQSRCGVFQAAFETWYAESSPRTWHHYELRRELDWFIDHLDEPRRLYYRLARKGERSGVCWFRDCARAYITRARYMAWLLCDLGIDVQELHCANPGPLIWQDRNQVVALRPRAH